jgi:hypothetical protein
VTIRADKGIHIRAFLEPWKEHEDRMIYQNAISLSFAYIVDLFYLY